MPATGLKVFDETLQKTHLWLNEIANDLGPDRQRAYDALRAVLHTLRDRLPVDNAAQLGAQLPMLVRGIFFEGYHPAGKPDKIRSQDEFLDAIGKRLRNAPRVNVKTAAQAVFRAIEKFCDPHEAAQVRQALPQGIQALWPERPAELRTQAAATADRD